MIEFRQSVGATWGIGAVFAVLMFFILMKVFKMMREDRKFFESQLTKVIDAYNKASKAQQKATIKNTKVQSELFTWLKGKNGHG